MKSWANSQRPSWLPDGVVLRAANQNLDDCQWQSYLDLTAGSPQGLTCAPAGAMQASNRRQAALSESQRGFAVGTHAFMKSQANTHSPLAPRWGSWQAERPD